MFHHLKAIMLIVATAYATWRCTNDEITARRETSPTPINMADFARDYRGQQWLALTGQLDTDAAIIRSASNAAAGNSVRIWVPLVDPGARPDDPVHVFVLYSPVSPAAAKSYAAS